MSESSAMKAWQKGRELRDKKKDAAEEMYDALKNIVANADMRPDANMSGTTDIYAVPLDDIERARTALAKADGKAVTP